MQKSPSSPKSSVISAAWFDSLPRVRDEALSCVLGSPLNNRGLLENALATLATNGVLLEDADLSDLPSLAPTFFFDAEFYLARNGDVVESGVHPYLHFIVHGVGEGRNPHPLVDLAFIQSRLGDTEAKSLTLEKLAEVLFNNELQPHPWFDIQYYLDNNQDVRDAGMSALQHYIEHGAREGRSAHAAFDYDRAIEANVNVPRDRYAAFLHCVSQDLIGLVEADESPVPVESDEAEVAPESAPARAASSSGEEERPGAPSTPLADHPPVKGAFDAVRSGMAYGWALCPSEPDTPLLVEIVSGSRVVGRGIANDYRADLKEAGLGDGHFAFGLPLSRELCDGHSHTLSARVAGRDQWLHGTRTLVADPVGEIDFDSISARETSDIAAHLCSIWSDRRAADEFVTAIDEANLWLELGEAKEALEAFAAIARRYPDDALLPIKLAEAHLGLGRADLALAHYQQAQPTMARLVSWRLLGIGNAHRLLGDWDAARDCYEQGLALAQEIAPLAMRLRQAVSRRRVLEARRLLSAGDNTAALRLLAAELVGRSDDAQIKRLVYEAASPRSRNADRSSLLLSDVELASAEQSVRLLEVVCSYLETDPECPT